MRSPFAAAAALTFAAACGTASAQTSNPPLSRPAATPPASPSLPASLTPVAATSAPVAATSAPAASVPSTAPFADQPLAPVVVTATRTPEPLRDTLQQTTVFDAQAIANSGVTDLPALLSFSPGAELVSNGPPGSNTSLFLRGANSNQALVLVDGVRIDSVSSGAADISQLQLDSVDRVEVVNGNVSALYGSGAIGGVVQIFTKDGGNHPPRFNFQTEYGSYHTQRQSAGVNGALDASGDTTFNLSLSRFKTDGFSSIDPNKEPAANPDANGFRDTTVAGTLKHRFNADWDAGIRYFQADGKVSFDNAFGMPTDQNDTINEVRSASAFVDGRLNDRWTTHLSVGDGADHSTSYLNGASDGTFNTTTHQLNWQNEFALAAQHQLVFGYDRLDQRLDSDEYGAPERHVNSAYVGYNGRLGANQFQLNVRRDQYSDFGGANSYYAGYGYDFDAHWKAIASVADAFRAPSFNELYFPFFGTPTLQPERSHTVEAALQYASPTLGTVRLTAFQTRYRNLIDADAVTFLAENVGRAKVQGLEGAWTGRIAHTDVRASITVQNPIDEDTDQDLARRARHFATLALSHNFSGWRVGGDWRVSGMRNDGGEPLSGYGVLNLNARYDITKSWFVAARIENVLNRDYELAYAYNTPGRGAYLTLGWQQP